MKTFTIIDMIIQVAIAIACLASGNNTQSLLLAYIYYGIWQPIATAIYRGIQGKQVYASRKLYEKGLLVALLLLFTVALPGEVFSIVFMTYCGCLAIYNFCLPFEHLYKMQQAPSVWDIE
ncbi:MAG: hypothetical protein EP332_04115 [Bacteroidetes bacterium]|nr:MAG: hypothetical protein EP332_04115 [Bacteroidota bacterium]